ncbi:hypothetical protein SmJEL517_g05291 [Synchytrium microbalum]|uniref:GH16 domain-containing protein n=1 Tax=Synchytrium microbalum TaxID=1806994 RepID=A0A507BW67_9FUNG|nr:uncharacterized protein SmJEL517_g05291 [Synchytrium microbalum]TPX31371.1 hypothetical protein SmJEL517_g05291 [Synchytrium microbalum]
MLRFLKLTKLTYLLVLALSPAWAQTYPICNSAYMDILNTSFQTTNGKVAAATTPGLNNGITLTMIKNVSDPTAYQPTSCGFAATLKSVGQLQYGVMSMRVKTASTTPGVVTAFILRSTDGDEIDWEWVGGNKYQAQSNYFWRGNQSNFGNSGYHNNLSDTTVTAYTYTIEWTNAYIRWWIDDKLYRTVAFQDTRGQFPTSLANVELGVWDGGCSQLGVRNWAGGIVPNGVYSATMDSFKACNFVPSNGTGNGTFVAIPQWASTYVLNGGLRYFEGGNEFRMKAWNDNLSHLEGVENVYLSQYEVSPAAKDVFVRCTEFLERFGEFTDLTVCRKQSDAFSALREYTAAMEALFTEKWRLY